MSHYIFENIIVNKPGACHQYIQKNVTWNNDFNGLSTNPLRIEVLRPLLEEELNSLTILLNNYVDPSIFLQLNRTETICLHSHFTTDSDNVVMNDSNVIQTFIFSGNSNESNVALDSAKTVIEYLCPNPQTFLNDKSGNITLDIYDITRNVLIASQNIELNTIADEWNTLAQSGSSNTSTLYRSLMFTGLMNKNTSHDCIWQFRGKTSRSDFTFRINGLQYIYYDIIM